MKRTLTFTLTLTLAMVLAASLASAKEVTMQGQFETTWQWTDNTNFLDTDGDNAGEDDFAAQQRIRQYFNYVDSENLSGTVAFEMDTDWGNPANGGQLGTDSSANANTIRLKRGYIDFNWPGSSLHVRSGLQGLAFPGAVAGSPIWDDDVAGIVASYGISDTVSLVAGWARLYDRNIGTDGTGDNEKDEIDAFTVILPITMDGWSLTPYVIYAMHGRDAVGSNSGGGTANDAAGEGLQGINGTGLQDDMDIFWAGGAFTLSAFDPFNFAADLVYGSVDGGSNGTRNDREGWFFSALATYSMDMVTPGVFFAYGTGEDDDPNNGSESFPTLGGAFAPTSFGFDGSNLHKGADQQLDGGGTDYSAMVVGLGLYDFSVLENLTHTARLAYGVGTNDADLTKRYEGNLNANRGAQGGVIFTEDDSFWEVNLDSTYSLYEALTAYIEIGYIDLDLDKDAHPALNTDKMESAWKLAVGLQYNY